MIKRTPCEAFIRYLVAHPDGFSVRNIEQRVSALGLDYLDDEHVVALRVAMRPPSPFRPFSPADVPSQTFINKYGLAGFFWPDEVDQIAHNLVENAQAREIIETMTLASEQLVLIDHLLREQGISSSVAALERYNIYYWDIRSLDSTQLRILLRNRGFGNRRAENPTDLDPVVRSVFSAIDSARYRDPRRLSVDITVKPVASILQRMRLGYLPTKVDVARLAQAARVTAVARSLNATMEFGKNSAAEARDYALVAKAMTEILSEVGNAGDDLYRELRNLHIKTEDVRPPMLGELSSGMHTTEMLPVHKETEDGEAAPELDLASIEPT